MHAIGFPCGSSPSRFSSSSFDVEVAFFYPAALVYRAMGAFAAFELLLFLTFLLIGFLYVLARGALEPED